MADTETTLTRLEFGDIILAPTQHPDLTGGKVRPVVVVSNRDFHLHSLNVIVMSLSAEIPDPLPKNLILLANWKEMGLHRRSVIKPVLHTISQGLDLTVRAHLDEATRSELRALLARIIG